MQGSAKVKGVTRSVVPLLFLLSTCLPAPASANSVEPLVIDEATFLSSARPWVSPTGEQLVTYLRQDQGTLPVPGLVARTGGAAFSPFEALSLRPGLTPPTAGFAPDGTARLVWQAAGSGNLTEQAVRPAGGPPGAAAPAGACNGPAALAVTGTGTTLSACRADSGAGSSWSGLAGIGQMPSAIAPGVEVTPAVEELTSDPLVAWGADGTGIVAFGYREAGAEEEEGGSDGEAGDAREKWTIAARVVAADGSFGETELVDSVVDPARLVPTGVAVLPNGTTAITADSSDGALLFTRPAGPGGSFERIVTGEDTATMPAADQWGRLHFLSSTSAAPGAATWWVRVREPGGTLREAIPVPTEGGSPVPVEGGLQVYRNGAEAVVTRSDTGFFVTFRRPGGGAFSVPRRLASSANTGASGSVVRTPQGDLLLAWEREATPTRRQLMVGGWDSGARPTIDRVSMPKRVRKGRVASFSVLASDPMGISRIVWKFPRNRRAEGASVRFRLTRPGMNRVQVAVFDRSGARSVRIGRVKVVTPKPKKKKGRPQGRAGTSGSPRP